jgi:hypothetical protein
MAQAQIDHDKRDYPRLPKEVPLTITKLEYPFSTEVDQSGFFAGYSKRWNRIYRCQRL